MGWGAQTQFCKSGAAFVPVRGPEASGGSWDEASRDEDSHLLVCKGAFETWRPSVYWALVGKGISGVDHQGTPPHPPNITSRPSKGPRHPAPATVRAHALGRLWPPVYPYWAPVRKKISGVDLDQRTVWGVPTITKHHITAR